jgi:hypothetical protein
MHVVFSYFEKIMSDLIHVQKGTKQFEMKGMELSLMQWRPTGPRLAVTLLLSLSK